LTENPETPESDSEKSAPEASPEVTASNTSDEAPAAVSEPTSPEPEAASEASAEAEQPVAESSPAEAVAESSSAEEAPPAAADEEDIVVVDPTSEVVGEVEYIEEDEAPRQKPAIPGADLIPDIVTDSDQFLDAEARAAAEAEAEEAARRAADEDPEIEAKPIADAAINLAAGARYTATGKRKTAVARVIVKPGTGNYSINGKSLEEFFPRETLQRIIRQPLEAVGYEARMDVTARMHGGGVSAQAGALRHGISKALLEADPNLRGELKRRGFLTRDPRVKERKKAGLKKARKRPQFSKR
jgi:small subunit ribosomal protein S9